VCTLERRRLHREGRTSETIKLQLGAANGHGGHLFNSTRSRTGVVFEEVEARNVSSRSLNDDDDDDDEWTCRYILRACTWTYVGRGRDRQNGLRR